MKSLQSQKSVLLKKVAFFSGPVVVVLFLIFGDLEPGKPEVTRTAALALLMAIWWITEAVPLAITALLPAIFFPIFQIMKAETVAPVYFNKIILLFLGGFMIALAMERWQLHRRIALQIIAWIGASPRRILMGFMIATGFLSMWISNTATAMMMLPIAVAIISKLEEKYDSLEIKKFAVALLLAIAYSASIGGLATIIGTPPNLILVRVLQIQFPMLTEISFTQWLIFAFPISLLFLFILWLILTVWGLPSEREFPVAAKVFETELQNLGPITYEEKVVLFDFIGLVVLLVSRQNINIGSFVIPGWSSLFPDASFVDDGTVALTLAIILFIIPTQNGFEQKIMDWQTARKLPWNIILLFGGGFALAEGFKNSGLSLWVGNHLKMLIDFPPILIVMSVCLLLTFLTELTSNTATTNMILPILASLSTVIHVNPLLLMIPATLSASCAFMLPVATPPNAIIFGSDRIHISDMARIGIFLNFIGVLLFTAAIFIIGNLVFNVLEVPTWLK